MYRSCLLIAVTSIAATSIRAAEFDDFVKPLLEQKCIKCHGGGKKVQGEVNFKQIATAGQFLEGPELINRMIDALDANDMPPEGEPELDEKTRARLVASLKTMLRESTAGKAIKRIQIRRLNRFQYNNVVKDLFQLKLDVFKLPEKLMTRHDNYLHPAAGKMPDKVNVASLSLKPKPGLSKVRAFPKDLRASHGFDNQANQLTLSPLLLDAFLRLSVSIVNSPDFNEQNVGIWNDFFKAPAEGADKQAEVRRRLAPFLKIAFRGLVEGETIDRYTAYTISKMDTGLSFTDSMKKVASAVLSSPLFLYRSSASGGKEAHLELASNLSFYLWASCPDMELLQLAERGELAKPEILNKTIERMFDDPKIERFLDTFPSQWMQLENVMAATPDPQKNKFFSLDKNNPASLQMVLEPLLLFDAVFIEDRPIIELIAPQFSYRSDLLTAWYTTDLKPPPIDEARNAEENRVRAEKAKALETAINTARKELGDLDKAMVDPILHGVVTIDLSPGQAKWEAGQAKSVAESVKFSPWHRIGPFFGAASRDEAHAKAFLDPTKIDLRSKHGDLKWAEAKNYVDGQLHYFKVDVNCATYLYRTLHADSARQIDVLLGTDDGFKLWLNSALVAERNIKRSLAPDQERVRMNLTQGENKLLLKVVNGTSRYGFYFKAPAMQGGLPQQVAAALRVDAGSRTPAQKDALARHYLSIAPELTQVRQKLAAKKVTLNNTLKQLEDDLKKAPRPQDLAAQKEAAQRKFDDQMRNKLRSQTFQRVPASDPRFGGVITNAAVLSMTSGPKRTHPIARGAWLIEVIFNDPPPPPPNDIPPLNEDAADKNLTIREKFAVHRENPTCAGCHSKLDPLGFALENYDITGRWRDKYENGRDVDASGTLLRKYKFDGIVRFKESLVQENRRFARAFSAHMLRFALARELTAADSVTLDEIVAKTEKENFKLKSIIREVILSKNFSAVPAGGQPR
jgi:hypothetical protein